MKKKILHILSFAFLILFLCFIAVPTLGFADVGNQNDYDYSDDYDYDSSSYGNDSSSLSSVFTGLAFLDGGPVFGIIVVLIIVIILPILRRMARRKGPKFSRTATSGTARPTRPAPQRTVDPILRNQASIDIIQTSDENFSEEDFLAWVREVFVALNVAWTARDWTSIRVFEDDNLFREHEMQLEDYIRRNQINQIERLGITEAAITDHDLDANREYVTVKVRAHMVDYVIDERTKAVVSGDSSRVVHMQYTLKFMRTLGTKTLGNLREIGVTNCPNCGAPTKLTAAGQCEYCKTIITSGTYNWMLVSYTGVHAD